MSTIKIKKIEKNTEVKPVYDVQVEDTGNYVLENGTLSHNSGFVYASSIVVASQKLKLKEDEDGNKTSDVHGIKTAAKIMKSRYGRAYETCKLNIRFDSGLDRYSGLFNYMEEIGILERNGNKYRYTCKDGTEINEFKKSYTPEIFERIIDEWDYDKYKLLSNKLSLDEEKKSLGLSEEES